MAFTINPPRTALATKDGYVTAEWYRFFARIQSILGDDVVDRLLSAPYITWSTNPTLENERVLSVTSTLTLNDTGSQIILGLAETGFAAGFYGSTTQTLGVRLDLYGRVTGVEVYDLNSDNVLEGTAHLFYTDERARAALSGIDGIDYDSATGEIALTDTTVTPGTYGSATDVPVLTIDQQGRITGATTAAIPTYATDTWTPVDASPDGLALTVVRAVYTQIGRLVIVEAQITYPVTASSSGAALSGLPFVPAGAGAGSYYCGTAAGALYQSGGTLYPASSTGAAVQNSQLSGQTLAVTYTYSV